MSTDLVKETRQKVEARIKELRPYVDELSELERLLSAMDGGKARRRPASAPAKGGTKGRKPERASEFLKLIDKTPGITVAEAAKTMGIKPNYLYRVARDLSKGSSPQIVKAGSGYKVATSSKGDATQEAPSAPVEESKE